MSNTLKNAFGSNTTQLPTPIVNVPKPDAVKIVPVVESASPTTSTKPLPDVAPNPKCSSNNPVVCAFGNNTPVTQQKQEFKEVIAEKKEGLVGYSATATDFTRNTTGEESMLEHWTDTSKLTSHLLVLAPSAAVGGYLGHLLYSDSWTSIAFGVLVGGLSGLLTEYSIGIHE